MAAHSAYACSVNWPPSRDKIHERYGIARGTIQNWERVSAHRRRAILSAMRAEGVLWYPVAPACIGQADFSKRSPDQAANHSTIVDASESTIAENFAFDNTIPIAPTWWSRMTPCCRIFRLGIMSPATNVFWMTSTRQLVLFVLCKQNTVLCCVILNMAQNLGAFIWLLPIPFHRPSIWRIFTISKLCLLPLSSGTEAQMLSIRPIYDEEYACRYSDCRRWPGWLDIRVSYGKTCATYSYCWSCTSPKCHRYQRTHFWSNTRL